jgi:hypothetical protein
VAAIVVEAEVVETAADAIAAEDVAAIAQVRRRLLRLVVHDGRLVRVLLDMIATLARIASEGHAC